MQKKFALQVSPTVATIGYVFFVAIVLVVHRWVVPGYAEWQLGAAFAAYTWHGLSVAGGRLWEKALLGAWGILFAVWAPQVFMAVEQSMLGSVDPEEYWDIAGPRLAAAEAAAIFACGVLTAILMFAATRSARILIWAAAASALAAILSCAATTMDETLIELLGGYERFQQLMSVGRGAGVLLWHGVVVWALFRWARTQARRRAGCCINCGYDLAAVSDGVCPECGSAQAKRP